MNGARGSYVRSFLLGLVVCGLSIVVSNLPLVQEFGQRITDIYFRTAPPPRLPSAVTLVLIDDQSLARYGRWPWSRTKLAELITALQRGGASVIGVDILLAEAESPEADGQLANTLRESGRVVLVDKITTFGDGQIHWIEPLAALRDAAAGVGHAHAVLDADGFCRRFPPRELSVNGPQLAFAIEAAKLLDEPRAAGFLRQYGIENDAASPVIKTAPVLIPIAYRRNSFVTISAADVLEGRHVERLNGRAVLLGFGSTELGDRVNTPLMNTLPTPGVEVHAQILDSVLTGRYVKQAPAFVNVLLLLLASASSVLAFRNWRGWGSAVRIVVVTGVVYLAGWITYVLCSWMISPGPLLIAVFAAPLVVQADHLFELNRSLTRQVDSLRQWLRDRHSNLKVQDDLSSRVAVLQTLQAELGTLYELHVSLLEASSDAIGIFNESGELLLQNTAFRELFRSVPDSTQLQDVRSQLVWSADAPEAEYPHGKEGEARVGHCLFAVRTTRFSATQRAPGGGTVLLLTSLKVREERDRSRAEALAFVTHELRSPLTSILGFAEFMMRYPNASGSERAPRTIYRESKRLLALIHSYLDVLRTDAGARELNCKPVSVGELVQQVFELLFGVASGEQMTLQAEGDDLLVIEADKALLQGAVLNLVTNSIKYGTPGTLITVRWSESQRGTDLTVSNVSEGLEPNHIQDMFNTYRRGPKVGHQPGWGIGLAFVKRIAEKHGGSLSAECAGTEVSFTIHLPARAAVIAAKGAR